MREQLLSEATLWTKDEEVSTDPSPVRQHKEAWHVKPHKEVFANIFIQKQTRLEIDDHSN